MRRTVIPELLDSDAGTASEISASLHDLRAINRRFGGVRTSRLLLAMAMRRAGLREATLLSVAAGDGWSIATAAEQLARRGLKVTVTVLDRSAAHLQGSPVPERIVADAFPLPLADRSFDFVECSLFAHHLEPEEVQALTREALRVARWAFLVNDLRRSRLGWVFAHLGFVFYRSRLTRHDAPASVRRAYAIPEMRRMLSAGNAREVAVWPAWFFRMGAIAWRHTRS